MAKLKVLVVDDEPDVVSVIERALVSENFDVIVAYDGINALDIAESEKPDLILLDIMMPMMSGFEVCEQLKARSQTRDIPVVCLTSANAREAHMKSLELGAATVIIKPFLPAELIAKIRRHLPKQEE